MDVVTLLTCKDDNQLVCLECPISILAFARMREARHCHFLQVRVCLASGFPAGVANTLREYSTNWFAPLRACEPTSSQRALLTNSCESSRTNMAPLLANVPVASPPHQCPRARGGSVRAAIATRPVISPCSLCPPAHGVSDTVDRPKTGETNFLLFCWNEPQFSRAFLGVRRP